MLHRLTAHDHRMISALARREAPRWLDRFLRRATHAGGATATTGLSLVLIVMPDTRHLGLRALVANCLSHLAVQALKRTVVRPRPSVLLPHIAALAELPDHFSFPSGHACAAFAVVTPILLAAPSAGLPLLLVALAVGASRVYLRVHYVTDVVVGQMLGAAAGVVAHVSLA
ncbi:MAG: phosphatase PAP2 family protein [Gemmatimonadales bacterium]